MDRAPSYLSQTKAEAILSEVRPTKVKTDTLICVNVFLDELLWLVLSTARSFSTDRLKIGLLKTLPTSLGKDALLEAEVELKAYWEKTGINALRALESSPAPSPSEFPLQAAFELLRHKCEAYSTLGEMDEDADVEARLQTRMLQSASTPPNANAVAPAALYLTAVLEHVCEHILVNVARVVGRDASRSSAHVSDLNLALCEDDAMYQLFKTMKVHEQIERQSKSVRPRRSKSISRGDSRPPSRTGSPNPPSPSDNKMRSSADTSGAFLTSGHPPSSADKARAIKMFKNSSDSQSGKDHQRTTSVMSESTRRTMLAFQNQEAEDENGTQDFDDLMRSGTTMKVSLTPDRLKTFEVYNKQKIAKAAKATPPSANAEPAPPFKSIRPVASVKSIGRASELLDDRDAAALSRSPRNHSIATPAEAGIRVTPQRRGSGSNTPPQANPGLLRKASLGNAMASGPSAYGSSNTRRNLEPTDMSNGIPKRNRTGPRGPARNRESLDLDDVMDIDEEISFGPPPMTPKAAAPSGTSSSTRDLIDFLSEGPPEVPSLPPLQTNGLNDKAPAPKSGGRLRNMFSRAGRQQSTEVLNMSPSLMQPKNLNGAVNGLGRSNSSLKKQRSAGNLTAPRPTPQPFPPPEFPRPPNYARSSAPPSPTLTSPGAAPASPPDSTYGNTGGNNSSERSRVISVSRKAVPVWDANQNQSLPVPSPTMGNRSPSETRPPPSPKPSTSSIGGNHGSASTPTKESPNPNAVPSIMSSSSRRAGMVPAPRSAGIPNLPAAKAVDVVDMRKKLARATSVPEARLLVDMFLAQWGFTAASLTQAEMVGTAAELPPAITLNGGAQDDDHGVGVVEVLLGEGTEEVALRTPRSEEQSPAGGVGYANGHAGRKKDISITSSPTVSDTPLTPSSFSTAKMMAPASSPGPGARTKQVSSPTTTGANNPGSGQASQEHGGGRMQHHHRYGNAPVVVG